SCPTRRSSDLNGRGRSGYEFLPEDGNRAYVIAQFYPRMAVYNDVEGWQNSQFWGRDECALPFGNFEVNITVPADHMLDGTGKLMNRKEVFTKEMMKRYEKAQKSYDKPVIIVSQEEAEAAEKGFSDKTKTWKLYAENVRDFGFATSRKFIWDMMAVKIGDKDVMAVSMYPKEGNPLWEEWSTYAVAATLKTYSRMTFEYPYHKAISVHAKNQGMEYPMICWNYGRPDENGNYSDRTKYGMISVIIHEVGHNYFPMIVNSDERQWTWMDEGLNTFLEYLTEELWDNKFPSRRGPAHSIVDYMKLPKNELEPIMTNSENIINFGPNAYSKPATGLNILRETIMGRELFDYAFKEYARRWAFKHPSPADFFRTMEDASAEDLDWFWRGWFYSTDVTDISIDSVKYAKANVDITIPGTRTVKRNLPKPLVNDFEDISKIRNRTDPDIKFDVDEDKDLQDFYYRYARGKEPYDSAEYEMPVPVAVEKLNPAEAAVYTNKHMYELSFSNKGGLVMPIIIEWTFKDGSKEIDRIPAQVWRHNENNVVKTFLKDKEVASIQLDPL